MIANGLINLYNWLWDNVISRAFFTDIPFMAFSTYKNALETIVNLVKGFTFAINQILPLDTAVYLILAMIMIYVLMFGFKTTRFFINLLRGAGA